MKWLSITTGAQEKIYELWNSKKKLLVLAYHPKSGSVRVSTGDEKRVFLIGREGFLRRRTVLRNEYGIRIGQLTYDNSQYNHGLLDVDGKDFTYVLQNDGDPQASIYSNMELRATCELPVISQDINSDNYDLLMLILSWYISAAVKRPVEEFA